VIHVAQDDVGSPCHCGSGRELALCCFGREAEMAARRHDFALGELADGRPAAAVKALKQAVALDRNRASAYHDLGLALKDLGRSEEAERAHRDALRLDSTYAVAHQKLGELLRDRGELEEARRCFESALRLDSALNESRLNLGQLLEDLGELVAAARCYEEAIPRSSAPAGIYMKLGAVVWKLGDSARALEAFEHSVLGAPASAEALYNLGSAQLELGRFEAAERSAQRALSLRPVFSEALTLRAAALAASGAIEAAVDLLRPLTDQGASSAHAAPGAPVGRNPQAAARYLLLATRLMNSRLFEPARRCLEAALREDPTEVMADHLLSALSGTNPDHPVEGYVRQLFDTSAATFDRDLVSKLGYDIPREMVEAVLGVAGEPEGRWEVLDLGCGTGLVGEQIAPHCRRLVGVDVAPNMIEHARARNVYTDLQCADLTDTLALEEMKNSRFDVVTAADVFIYVGKLDNVIPAIRRVLRPGGWFAFSAESAEHIQDVPPAEYRLGVMGRYAHSAAYLRRLAAVNGFDIELLRPTRIRFEHRRPVEGWLTVWRIPR
jgi:predicted TPR repeat methyltransferase/Flp pilus assembly protein TadD